MSDEPSTLVYFGTIADQDERERFISLENNIKFHLSGEAPVGKTNLKKDLSASPSNSIAKLKDDLHAYSILMQKLQAMAGRGSARESEWTSVNPRFWRHLPHPQPQLSPPRCRLLRTELQKRCSSRSWNTSK